ncbi:Oligosaccaryltransferase-domain-containing protein [Dichotomocladium elegans]|nr:Oligosaccaryltransferase-domain-containing protein [Dichotomocladium elegans]
MKLIKAKASSVRPFLLLSSSLSCVGFPLVKARTTSFAANSNAPSVSCNKHEDAYIPMITDNQLALIANSLGLLTMVLIVAYHFISVNANVKSKGKRT